MLNLTGLESILLGPETRTLLLELVALPEDTIIGCKTAGGRVP
jgi:hypothetical protein